MDFISNEEQQIKEMLAAIGVSSIDELFVSIPESLRLPKPSQDDGLSEYEGKKLMENLAAKNTFPAFDNYLGAGAYEHHVPALVGAICSKSEFLTSYTPYQAEASQGMLQIIFEFQSAICALTGMDVSNASVYDGASACAEACLMALRYHKERKKILIAESLHPNYLSVIKQYINPDLAELVTLPFDVDGLINREIFNQHLDENTAAIIIQYPNFFGVIEDVSLLTALAKENGALSIICGNPLAYGLIASPSEVGADIAVGDCQALGLPLHFGGPYVGYMACKQELVRQLPGRIVGETVDTEGKRGFVLTLQAREQHIRREKATSNICTNQALAALASLVAVMWYGPEGLKKLALTNYQRTAYLMQQLSDIKGIKLLSKGPHFNEFVVTFQQPAHEVQNFFRSHKIEPGLSLEPYFPSLKNYFLMAVTETKSQKQLDHFVQVAEELMRKNR